MEEDMNSYEKGELVSKAGTYRCIECGEVWTTDQVGVRFPPCDACKGESGRWVLVQAAPSQG